MHQLAGFLISEPLLLSLGGLFIVLLGCTALAGRLKKRGNPLSETLTAIALAVIPTCMLLAVLLAYGHLSADHRYVKIIETALGIETIWILLTLLKAAVLTRTVKRGGTSRISGLMLDLIRLTLVVIGAVIVFASVWDRDITNFLATLGVGSVVIGLALQDTLGNLFAGIALVSERPFKIGDWIKVGDLTGAVIETNWRSVRLLSREEELMVVPNSILGREKITNFSQPSRIVGMRTSVGFSYSDPPNKVKKVLLDVLRGTHGVVFEPHPRIRTQAFGDFAVTYEIRFFIKDFEDQPEIEEDFKTRVWYAARRHNLTIPFPTRVVYKTEVPPSEKRDQAGELITALSRVPLFAPLKPEEIDALARDVMTVEYGHGERVVEQGDRGDSLFLVQAGTAQVAVRDASGKEREIARLGKGDVFGEMALLTGEARTATVIAESDLAVLMVYKESLQEIFTARPELAGRMAEIAASRRLSLEEAQASVSPAETVEKTKSRAEAVLGKIRSFFGMEIE